MTYQCALLGLALSSIPCLAQESEQYQACSERAKTQAQLNICANEEASRIDAELNAIYQTLLLKASKDAKGQSQIKAAERFWIAYRDAYIDAMYPAKDKQGEYGSTYPMEVDLLRAKLTQQHVAALKQLLAQYGG